MNTVTADSQARTTPNRAEVEEWLPLVHRVVASLIRKFPPNVLRDDLVAAGTCGLIDALARSPQRDQGFEWYARTRIRGAIIDELRSLDWLSRRERMKIRESVAAGATPSMLPPRGMVAFDDLPASMQGMNIADESALNPLQQMEERFESSALMDAIESLPVRERRIVTAHYFQGRQLKAVAQELGVSEPRVSQLHARAMQMLKAALGTKEAA
ncbi:MAG TPA: sigma-70 family RNA polymerase sigma factor [Polyangiaceae bacterium]